MHIQKMVFCNIIQIYYFRKRKKLRKYLRKSLFIPLASPLESVTVNRVIALFVIERQTKINGRIKD